MSPRRQSRGLRLLAEDGLGFAHRTVTALCTTSQTRIKPGAERKECAGCVRRTITAHRSPFSESTDHRALMPKPTTHRDLGGPRMSEQESHEGAASGVIWKRPNI